MEQRQSDEPNEAHTTPETGPKPENRPADTQEQPTSEKPSVDQQDALPRPANQRNDAQPGNEPRDVANRRNPNPRDNRQQSGRPNNNGPRDETQRNNRNNQEAGSLDRGSQERGPQDRGQRNAGSAGPQDRGNQERGQRNPGSPERGSRDENQRNNRDAGTPDRGPRNAGAPDREPQEGRPQDRGQRNNGSQERGQRDAGSPDRGQQERVAQERGPRNAGSPERGQQERGQNQRPDSRNDRDRNQGSRDRNAHERDIAPRDYDDLDGQLPPNTGRKNPESESEGREDRLIIGISLGDYNGIGPEVILKALQYNRLQKICTPVIYGSMRILNRYRNILNLKDWNLNGAPTIGQISHKMTNVITCWPDQNQDIQPGQVTAEAGQAAFACLQRAVDDLKDGKIDALVTAPINKYNIQSEEFKFPGHTEYLAQEFGVADNLMFLVSERLRVGVVTGHVPLGSVRQNITKERITEKLMLMMQSLKQDFGIEKPKIAVLGLNPHAGEEGLLGNEENDIIKPLIEEWRTKGQLVFGPYPADGFFGTRSYAKFDAVLAMYHDQGLIPFKAIAFEEGVNFTAGMPVVRTSPDHGTAYDIAGKDLADETSMLQAIYTAVDVARQRKEFIELELNALK